MKKILTLKGKKWIETIPTMMLLKLPANEFKASLIIMCHKKGQALFQIL